MRAGRIYILYIQEEATCDARTNLEVDPGRGPRRGPHMTKVKVNNSKQTINMHAKNKKGWQLFARDELIQDMAGVRQQPCPETLFLSLSLLGVRRAPHLGYGGCDYTNDRL